MSIAASCVDAEQFACRASGRRARVPPPGRSCASLPAAAHAFFHRAASELRAAAATAFFHRALLPAPRGRSARVPSPRRSPHPGRPRSVRASTPSLSALRSPFSGRRRVRRRLCVWPGDDSSNSLLPTPRVAQLVPLIVDVRDDPAQVARAKQLQAARGRAEAREHRQGGIGRGLGVSPVQRLRRVTTFGSRRAGVRWRRPLRRPPAFGPRRIPIPGLGAKGSLP